MKIESVPESIISQARHILQSKNYSSEFKREVVRLMIGACSVCDDLPSIYVIDKQDNATVITRYCDKDFVKYQKYNKPKRKMKVKKKSK